MVRIEPVDIRKKGRVPKNGSLFFTIFQTFMSGPPKDGQPSPYFGDYSPDFFDFIVIDECHRGGANDESNWRGIMEYFAPAVQLGLTATPKRKDNVDTYRYFGDPVYIYSLQDGINDGFLTPFKVKIGTQLPPDVWLAVDRRTAQPASMNPQLRVVRVSGQAFSEGIVEQQIEGVKVRVYCPAKTVVDCFKFRNKVGLDVALEALQDGWRSHKLKMADLVRFAKVCRVERVMRPYLESLT